MRRAPAGFAAIACRSRATRWRCCAASSAASALTRGKLCLQGMDVEMKTDASADAAAAPTAAAKAAQPEAEVYAALLTLLLLVDKQSFDQARLRASPSPRLALQVPRPCIPRPSPTLLLGWTQAKALSKAVVQRLGAFNRRSLDPLAARIYYYFSLAHENTGTLSECRRCGPPASSHTSSSSRRLPSLSHPNSLPPIPPAPPLRSALLALHRTSNLRQDSVGEEMLINLLLRNLLHYNQYDQAEKLRAKLTWPEKYSNQQYCRYLYYLGRIRCIELEYSAAKDCLSQASRKAPKAATGFRIMLYKWLVLVRLLLGEIPERTIFTQAGLEAPLKPYFALAQAVRRGDLPGFRAAAEEHAAVFAADKTANLIVRLRRNVIRTGLRRLSLAYSRISLADVAEKLGLASAEDAECIVSKAIRDGSIEAVLDHSNGWMQSHEVADVYASTQPQQEFHSRITFCLDLHNEAVKAMRFPGDGQKKSVETAEARRERCVRSAAVGSGWLVW